MENLVLPKGFFERQRSVKPASMSVSSSIGRNTGKSVSHPFSEDFGHNCEIATMNCETATKNCETTTMNYTLFA